MLIQVSSRRNAGICRGAGAAVKGRAPTRRGNRRKIRPFVCSCEQPWPNIVRSHGIACHALGFVMGILWTIIIGFLAGIIAKFLMPGPNEPSGFILTTILGIVGAFVATFLGQAVGWYGPNQGAGFIGAVVGAVVVLFIYGMIAGRRRTTI
jgi:uncharacterized membrane protein YeaQ/YmgE (transglycosylase-associated protein family)